MSTTSVSQSPTLIVKLPAKKQGSMINNRSPEVSTRPIAIPRSRRTSKSPAVVKKSDSDAVQGTLGDVTSSDDNSATLIGDFSKLQLSNRPIAIPRSRWRLKSFAKVHEGSKVRERVDEPSSAKENSISISDAIIRQLYIFDSHVPDSRDNVSRAPLEVESTNTGEDCNAWIDLLLLGQAIDIKGFDFGGQREFTRLGDYVGQGASVNVRFGSIEIDDTGKNGKNTDVIRVYPEERIASKIVSKSHTQLVAIKEPRQSGARSLETRKSASASGSFGRFSPCFIELLVLLHPYLSKHPNIVRFLGVAHFETSSIHKNRIFSNILEFSEYGSLEWFMAKGRHLPEFVKAVHLHLPKSGSVSDPSIKVGFCHDIIEGLRALHECDIVHNDIKPVKYSYI